MHGLSKKLQQKIYFLKKWLSFNVDSRILLMFMGPLFIESIMTLCHRVVTTASTLLGTKLGSIESIYIYKERVLNKANITMHDKRHPLLFTFESLPSGRRYCVRRCSKNRLNDHLFPEQLSFSIFLPHPVVVERSAEWDILIRFISNSIVYRYLLPNVKLSNVCASVQTTFPTELLYIYTYIYIYIYIYGPPPPPKKIHLVNLVFFHVITLFRP